MKVFITLMVSLGAISSSYAFDKRILVTNGQPGQGSWCDIDSVKVRTNTSPNILSIDVRSGYRDRNPCQADMIEIEIKDNTEGLLLYNAVNSAKELICQDSNVTTGSSAETIKCNLGLKIEAKL